VPLPTNKDVSILMTKKLYRSCALRGSETWPVKKENELALQWAEMRMIRSMCGVKLTDRFTQNELRAGM